MDGGGGGMMAITEFDLHQPATLADACALGKRLGERAAYLAGGTELIPDYQRRRESASHLIALGAIPELHGVSRAGDTLRIGALTTIAHLVRSPLVRAHAGVIVEAAAEIGNVQVRSVATVGGNCCRAVPCADIPPAAIVCGTRLRLMGPEGERTVDADQFFVGARRTVLRAGEVLVELLVPAQPHGSGASYQRFAHRRGPSVAVAAVAARIVLEGEMIAGARVALSAVAPAPLLVARAAALLEGARPSEVLIARAAECCADVALPITDVRGSAAFRRELVRVLARRSLEMAIARARSSRS